MEHKVVIIGNDHTNTLGVIRIFGENNIKPYVCLISNNRRNAVLKSKYIEKYWIFSDEETAVANIIKIFENEPNKVVLIPTSDASSLVLDKNYSILEKNFYTPNIGKQNYLIYKYMNKFEQQELLKDNDIKSINSQVIDLSDFSNDFKLQFPIILKPVISAEGKKEDIKICKNIEDFHKARKTLLQLGYSVILAQNFISYNYECDVQGYSFEGNSIIPGIIEKIRIYPTQKGSTTYGKVVSIEKYKKAVDGIKKIMKDLNYTGIFDIEIFVSINESGEDEFYLNEINFRNSAIAYAYGDSYIPYYWYKSCINNKLVKSPFINTEYTFMDDNADLHNIINKTISLNRYKTDKRNSKILLVKNNKDLKPSRAMFINKLIRNIFK